MPPKPFVRCFEVDQLGMGTSRWDDTVAGIVDPEEFHRATERFQGRVELLALRDRSAQVLLVVDEQERRDDVLGVGQR
jgi:hypothetical protein